MALRSNSMFLKLKSVAGGLTTGRTISTSTAPKTKPHLAHVSDYNTQQQQQEEEEEYPGSKLRRLKGGFTPVYVAIGMIGLQVGLGLFTVFHQLRRAPNVCVKKSRRERVVEVTEPELVAEEGDKFVKESFFRKIAHIQDSDPKGVIPNPIR